MSESGHTRLSGHHAVLLASSIGLIPAGFLPWYRPDRRGVDAWNGFDQPLAATLLLAVAAAALASLDAVQHAQGRPFLPAIGPFARRQVRLGLGLACFGLVAYKYLYRATDGTTGLYIGLGLAALVAYETYALGYLESQQAEPEEAPDAEPPKSSLPPPV